MPLQQGSPRPDSAANTVAALSPVGAIFRALVSTIVPEAVTLDEPSWVELESLVENALCERPVKLHRQLRLLLRVIQWLPVFRYGRCFTALNAASRTRVFSYLQDHRFALMRTGFWGLRTLAFLGYYGRPEAARDIGYAADGRGWDALR